MCKRQRKCLMQCERQIEIGFSQNTIIVCSSSMHAKTFYVYALSAELLRPNSACFCSVLLASSIDFNSNASQ